MNILEHTFLTKGLAGSMRYARLNTISTKGLLRIKIGMNRLTTLRY